MLAVLAVLAAGMSSATAADRIIKRNLDIVANRTVAGFDENGVRLDNGAVLTWDEIERATIAADKQAAFNAMLKELGEPLYRIRQRMAAEDYEALAPQAEALYSRYVRRDGPTAYLVVQGVMWSRLAAGKQEQALEPFLNCARHVIALADGKNPLPGRRRLRLDLKTGISADLPPVWFDAQAARAVLPGAKKTVDDLKGPLPGAWLYLATLAIAAGDDEAADAAMKQLPAAGGPLADLREVALAQRALAAGKPAEAAELLGAVLPKLPEEHRPLALYWLGRARAVSADADMQRDGLLDLLRIPALHAREHPPLAAAALHHAMERLAAAGDGAGSAACRRELLTNFGQTYHAGLVKAELNRAKDEPAAKPAKSPSTKNSAAEPPAAKQ